MLDKYAWGPPTNHRPYPYYQRALGFVWGVFATPARGSPAGPTSPGQE
jgi:hypothetical protein